MRLTLRTMLAYLDGVLEAQDAATLGKKIEESKFAGDLVARIRAVGRNQRLGVPRLEGKGMGLDPNTVAEYLGSQLPADRVADFEKVCLESDVHLAEVAACHHILTMVLGQPAEIKPTSRERMYRVGARVADAHAKQKSAASQSKGKPKVDPAIDKVAAAPKSSPAAPVAREAHAPAEERSPREQPARNEKATRDEKPARNEQESRVERPVREKPEVPDYLREARRRRVWPLLVTVLFAFLLAAVLLRALGPFDKSHPLARLVLGSPTEIAANNGEHVAPVVPGEKPPADKIPTDSSNGKKPVDAGQNEPGTTPEDNAAKPEKPVVPLPEPEPAESVPAKPARKPSAGARPGR